ncbi:hypothetical protein FVER14953_11661 [Fusarium verticillioides]|nr:hypothetical protein FVER14953_11661 [Fusarium verticillioides]
MVSFNDEEISKWNARASRHEKFFYSAGIATLGFTVLTALAFWKPELADLLATTLTKGLGLNDVVVSAGGQITGVGGAAISGLTTIYQYQEKSKALAALGDAKNRDSAGRVALQGVLVALRQTQATLALVYIVQVMRQPITCMGDEELERAVKMLGGDLQYLQDATYSQTLIQDRLDNLVQASIDLDNEYQRTMVAMNVVMDTVGRVVD